MAEPGGVNKPLLPVHSEQKESDDGDDFIQVDIKGVCWI